jgi:hypothetical protein
MIKKNQIKKKSGDTLVNFGHRLTPQPVSQDRARRDGRPSGLQLLF